MEKLKCRPLTDIGNVDLLRLGEDVEGSIDAILVASKNAVVEFDAPENDGYHHTQRGDNSSEGASLQIIDPPPQASTI